MLSGRKITATLTGEKMEGSVANCWLQRDTLLPLLCCLVVDEVIEGLDGNGRFTRVCTVLISRIFSNAVSQLLQVALSIERKRWGTTWISIYPQKFQHLNQYLMKPGHLDEMLERQWTILKMGGSTMHEYKGCRRIKYVQSVCFTSVPTLLVFYSALL